MKTTVEEIALEALEESEGDVEKARDMLRRVACNFLTMEARSDFTLRLAQDHAAAESLLAARGAGVRAAS